MWFRYFFVVLLVWGSASVAHAFTADVEPERYFYPRPSVQEQYTTPLFEPRIDPGLRVRFASELAGAMTLAQNRADVFVMSAGATHSHLVIISSVENQLNSIFRVRGFLSSLGQTVRSLPVTQAFPNINESMNVLDVAATLGFTRVVVSDGQVFSHAYDLSGRRR